MKHIVLLLYIISYTSGIISMALMSVLYIREKAVVIKYIILSDLLFTAVLFFDTFNFYTNLIAQEFPVWLQIFIISGSICSGIGMIYFFTISVNFVIGIDFSKNKRRLYFVTSILFLSLCICTIYLLCISGVISRNMALHSGFFLSNIFVSSGSIYNIVVVMKNWRKVDIRLKQFYKILVVFTWIITPMSLAANIVHYRIVFNFPLAFSPICYFALNLAGIILTVRYFRNMNSIENTSGKELKPTENVFEEILDKYNLTHRELEIARLISNGLNNHEIGEKLYISSNTARNHIYSIYKKLGIKNRYELISLISFNAGKGRTN